MGETLEELAKQMREAKKEVDRMETLAAEQSDTWERESRRLSDALIPLAQAKNEAAIAAAAAYERFIAARAKLLKAAQEG